VNVSVSVGPLAVRLVGVPQVLSAGQQYSLSCEAVGARPAPEMSWWVGDTRVDHLQKTITVCVISGHAGHAASLLGDRSLLCLCTHVGLYFYLFEVKGDDLRDLCMILYICIQMMINKLLVVLTYAQK
jgi:hypothetical protein